MKITLIFDMDGTIADTYNVPHWLEALEHSNVSPFLEAEPLWDMEKLGNLLRKLDVEIKVVSWLSKNSTKAFDKEVRKAKKFWLNENDFPCHHQNFIKYGTPKEYYRNRSNRNILIDDNKEVRESFCRMENCEAVDPKTVDIIDYLSKFLME